MNDSTGQQPDIATWDRNLIQTGGDLMQSSQWGQFKARHGWSVVRVQVQDAAGLAMAQVLFRRRGPVTLAYLPRGPVIAGGDGIARRLLQEVDDACRRQRAITLLVEGDRMLPPAWRAAGGFVPGPGAFQTARTVRVRLDDDDRLLAQMRRDTRQNVAHARRRGVTIDTLASPIDDPAIEVFYDLLRQTSDRNGFGIHARSYYRDFLDVFGNQAILLFARSGDEISGGLIAARFGSEARSMYAGSSSTVRGRGDAALLRFGAMGWARDQGCLTYDLGGIAPVAPRRSPAPDIGAGQGVGSSLDGIDQFKVGFGGEVVIYPATIERRYRPCLAWLVRRLSGRFRAAPIRSPMATMTGAREPV